MARVLIVVLCAAVFAARESALAQLPKPGGGMGGGGGGGGGSFAAATQEEAEAGADNTKGMTPLRTFQAVLALSPFRAAGTGILLTGGTAAIDTGLIPRYVLSSGAPAGTTESGKYLATDTVSHHPYWALNDAWVRIMRYDEGALASHAHSAADVTSGTLGAARGGLGADASGFSGVLRIASGAASVVPGTASNCVLVDGTSEPCAASVGNANDSGTFTSQTTVTISHSRATEAVLVECHDASGYRVEPDRVRVVDADTVTVTFASAQSGRCSVNTSGGTSGGGGGGGETNTASNIGTAGVGVFASKSGVDLRFKKLNAGSNKITITDDTGNNEVDIDVAQANLSLGSIGGTLAASQIASGSKQGNGSKIAMYSGGTPANGNCVKFDANGNITDAGDPCGTGGGGGGGSYSPGDGISISGSVISVDPAVVPQYLTDSATLDFGSIAANSCAELTMTVTGAATQDSVVMGLPPSLEAGLVVNMRVSAADTVTVRACKITSGSVDPAAQNFRATIVRSF
jgi:hypothetical protein